MSTTPSPNPTTRFTNRVDDYRRFRPGYPDALVTRLREIGALPEHAVVADIGSGTGISAELLLRHGVDVIAVEPNEPMRRVAEETLGREFGSRFRSVDGRAEATGLEPASVDMVLAAQAFHWFDRSAFHAECKRILRPRDVASRADRSAPGWIALVWNDRRLDSTPFLAAYEALLQRFGTDYRQVAHRNIDTAAIKAFFAPFEPIMFTLENRQRLDLEGLRGRTRSSSYVPAPDDPRHAPMIAELDRIFAAFAVDGTVDIDYDVTVSAGPAEA